MRYLIAALFFLAVNVADADIIDSATLELETTGSLNTIGGPGTIDHLLRLDHTDRLQSFDLVYLGTTAQPRLPEPQSVELDLQYFTPSFQAAGFAFPLAYLGQTIEVLASDPRAFFLLGLVEGSGRPMPSIRGTLAWPFGGISAVATTRIEMRAIGDSNHQIVAEPSSLFLLVTGLTLFGLSWRRGSHRS